MQPRIQYTKRRDGATTAYATIGSGPTLVLPPGGTTRFEWFLSDTEAHERFFGRLAEHRTLVLYDRHGCGYSDRKRTDFTLDDDMLDFEAVIEAVGADDLDLFGVSWGGQPSLAYAAKHPDRVRRMVLYGTFAAGAVGPRTDWATRNEALQSLRRTDWDLFCKTETNLFFPSGAGRETIQSMVRMLRDSTTPEMAEKLGNSIFAVDTQSLLPKITTPTLVLHRRDDQVCLFTWGQYMARHLPNARFVPLEGDAHYPWVDDAESVLRPTIEFLTGEAEPQPVPASRGDGTAVIVFLDVAGSTALTETLGDAVYREQSRALDTQLRRVIVEHGGAPIEGQVLGDGVMALFGSATQAISCALRCRDLGEAAGLPLHAGIHAGDVIREADNAYGGAVNLAARIAGASAAGEVLVSDTVRGLARTSAGVTFEDRGQHTLKGIVEQQRLWSVRS